jgi:hypothetical protein
MFFFAALQPPLECHSEVVFGQSPDDSHTVRLELREGHGQGRQLPSHLG